MIGPLLKTPDSYRSRKRLAIIALVCVAFVGVVLAALLPLRSHKSALLSGEFTWKRVEWRARLFARKTEGEIPDVSWRELWFMTHARGGFGLENFLSRAFSLEGTIANPYTTKADRAIGAQIFGRRCAGCHGTGGTGGHAPPLNRSRLHHGDSDFAIYKAVRDGIPQTGMAAVAMSPLERWQVIGYVRTLPQAASSQNADRAEALHIDVTTKQIRASDAAADEWLTYSRTLDGQRYTPLNQIRRDNVSQLKVLWIRQFESPETKSEATPIVASGVIFTTEPTPANVIALDARSGNIRWRYARSLPDKLPVCCSRSNRGLAILGDKLFLGALDDYLMALDANTGTVIWQTQVANPSEGFTMTGAPLIVNRSVVVGVAGGEYGIRGFLAAYDTETGREQWRFNTIPGPGEFGHDSWKNDAWKTGGGPTWITGSYDPASDMLYWGVGNPAPGIQGDVRAGDNLFTDSLLALHASTGKLAWYFQFTPHDEHDFDATQTPILLDASIQGVVRQVICVANRNGFYYVLDRRTGEFLLGVPFVEQNWAEGLDRAGRPILSSSSEGSPSGRLTRPGVGGGVNWQNAAFDPKSGLIFVPATEGASVFTKSPHPRRGDLGFYPGSQGGDYEVPQENVVRALDAATGARKWERWQRDLPSWKKNLASGYSGLLATGGGLVFGASGGFVWAIDSVTGHELWRVFLGGDTSAAPISFTEDGHQIVLVSAGRSLFAFGL